MVTYKITSDTAYHTDVDLISDNLNLCFTFYRNCSAESRINMIDVLTKFLQQCESGFLAEVIKKLGWHIIQMQQYNFLFYISTLNKEQQELILYLSNFAINEVDSLGFGVSFKNSFIALLRFRYESLDEDLERFKLIKNLINNELFETKIKGSF